MLVVYNGKGVLLASDVSVAGVVKKLQTLVRRNYNVAHVSVQKEGNGMCSKGIYPYYKNYAVNTEAIERLSAMVLG